MHGTGEYQCGPEGTGEWLLTLARDPFETPR